MSNFKSRQASAKKVIQLQNEVLSLKQELSKRTNLPEQEPCGDCSDCDCEDCTESVQKVQSLLDAKNEEFSLLQQELSSLKTDLKKVRSENTRLKKKIKDVPSEEQD